jgi:hypothetical protein
MTIKEKLKKMITSRGMFESQFDQVFPLIEAELLSFTSRASINPIDWEDSAESYPEILYKVIWVTSSPIILKWIDENCPNAWFRPMFAPTSV